MYLAAAGHFDMTFQHAFRYHPKENRHLKPRPRFPRRKWQKKEDEEEIRHFEAWLRKLAEKLVCFEPFGHGLMDGYSEQ